MRKTKIVCTIGPACDSKEMLTALCRAGMNVARLNFSHGTHEEHLKRINTIKEVRRELGLPIAIMLDTKGPEFRTRTLKDHRITLSAGQKFIFTTEQIVGDETRVAVSYEKLHEELFPGDTVLVSNGLLVFRVDAVNGCEIETTVITGGELTDRKSMSFPNKVLKQVFLSEQDKKDLAFGAENGVDYIACSFVSSAENLQDVHRYLREIGAPDSIELIAKIENRSGVDHLDEILAECDGVMVARGDLGVEVPFEELPAIQKHMITRCRLLGKRVITATEMLESMISNPRPTRAEISDVANAVYDGSSAIMLSGETAAGKYPAEAVATMARIAETTEGSINYAKRFHNTDFVIKNTVDAISHATVGMAVDIEAKAVVACTLSGMTARMVSRFRGPVDILGLTTDEVTYRKLSLSWGVTPVMCPVFPSTEILFYIAKQTAEQVFQLKQGDRLVITGGVTNGTVGNTNLIKVEEI